MHPQVQGYLQGQNDPELFAHAQIVRESVFGREVFLRGIVEFSSFCLKRCRYCGLRAPNRQAVRYRLDPQQIIEAACVAPELGLGTVVLQSGDDYSYDVDTICAIVTAIKKRCDVAVTLSLGDRPHEELARFRDSGADRYLLKLETTHPKLYARMRPGEVLKDRLKRLDALRRLGFEVGSGIIVGLPGSSLESLADDLLRLAALDLDMLAVGPFIPHRATPLGHQPHGSFELTLRSMALLRVLSPRSNIPATSALKSLPQHDGIYDPQKEALKAGCNVIMPSITPAEVRSDYEIYPGKNAFAHSAHHAVAQAKALILHAGYIHSAGRGDAPKELPCNRHLEEFAWSLLLSDVAMSASHHSLTP